jgi:hypothetical protein
MPLRNTLPRELQQPGGIQSDGKTAIAAAAAAATTKTSKTTNSPPWTTRLRQRFDNEDGEAGARDADPKSNAPLPVRLVMLLSQVKHQQRAVQQVHQSATQARLLPHTVVVLIQLDPLTNAHAHETRAHIIQ